MSVEDVCSMTYDHMCEKEIWIVESVVTRDKVFVNS